MIPEPLKVEYQYFRDHHDLPLITVCYLRGFDAPPTAIGIAICSDRDMPCKTTGKAIARQRALYAATRKAPALRVNRVEAMITVEEVHFPPNVRHKATIAEDPTFRFRQKKRFETEDVL